MKKMYVIFVAMLILVCAGCNNNVPVFMREVYQQRTEEASKILLKSEINDVKSFNREMNLVAYTAEKNIPFKVAFVYQDNDQKRVGSLPAISCRMEYINNYEYRQLFAADLTFELFEMLDAYELSDNGDIVGVTVNWERKGMYYSVCDADGDGIWDYLVQSKRITFNYGTVKVELTGLSGRETFRDLEKKIEEKPV